MDKYMSVKDAAELLGVTVTTIRRHIKGGTIRAYKKTGSNAFVVERVDVQKLGEPKPHVLGSSGGQPVKGRRSKVK